MSSDVFLVNEKAVVRLGAFEICLSKRPLRFILTFRHFQMLHKVQSAHRKLRQLPNVQSLFRKYNVGDSVYFSVSFFFFLNVRNKLKINVVR